MRKWKFTIMAAAAVMAVSGSLCQAGTFGETGMGQAKALGNELSGIMAQALSKMELVLTAVYDDFANDGKGAVRLDWEQSDGEAKAYGIYQKEEGQKEFRQIFFGSDKETEIFKGLVWEYEGQSASSVIPMSGFYSLAAQGAQGGNWGAYTGGLGGRTEAAFYLEKGEKLFVTVGGQNGFGGGGRATDFGSGGGCTVISSDKKGILLVAGGGGGATSSGSGLQGGKEISHAADGIDSGREGMAGGGGGSVGGKAGVRIPHVHSRESGCYRDGSYDAVAAGYVASPVEGEWWDDEWDWTDGSYIRSDFYFSSQVGGSGTLIPVKENTVLELGTWIYGEGINFIDGKTYIQVTNQNGTPLFTSTIAKLRQEWNAFEAGVVVPAGGGVYAGWPPIANIYTHTNWSQSNPNNGEYDILEGYEVSYPIFYGNGTARAAKVYLNSDYRNPIFAGNYAGEYYPPNNVWRSGILSRSGYGDRPLVFCERSKWYGTSGAHFLYKVPIPQGTTGIRVYAEGMMDSLQYHEGNRIKKPVKWCTVRFDKLRLCGGLLLDCKAKDIDIPAEGGYSYVNKKYALFWQTSGGVKRGNGNAWLKADKIGLTQAGGMDVLDAKDKAAPYTVDTDTVVMSPSGDHMALIEFAAAEDRGTRYLFRAESYSVLTGKKLQDSNIAECVVKTGVREYLYLVDLYGDTKLLPDAPRDPWQRVSAKDRRVKVEIGEKVQYLHIAAVDGAGNISDTVHVKLDPDSIEIAWGISTERIEVDGVIDGKEYGSVYPVQGQEAYYVKADGSTPFRLSFRSRMQGPARADYQISHQIFDLRTKERTQRHGMLLSHSGSLAGEEHLDAASLSLWREGAAILEEDSYMGAFRRRKGEIVDCWRGFIMPSSLSGETMVVVPVAGAAYGEDVLFSDWSNDMSHSVTLIGDGEGPMITGLEKMADWELIDRRHDSIMLEVSAMDELSGVKEFYLEIKNKDNLLEERIFPDEEGNIEICLTDDKPIFSGIFTVEAYAEDNVGNTTVTGGEITEFALGADVYRILSPHEPLFKRGESGILTLEAWGYAEKVEVEFPEFLSGYNRTFLYQTSPQHWKAEEIQFMIPLEAPEGIFEITVRAYKGDKKLETHPAISTLEVNGSVLDELRTRLR